MHMVFYTIEKFPFCIYEEDNIMPKMSQSLKKNKHDTVFLPRAACPEVVGISSEAVLKFIEVLEKENTEFHSLMFIRHGIVAAECHRFPFRADVPHCMYSISKNITSVAIGFAVYEGYIKLDDKVIDFFPEYVKKDDSNLDRLTIRHLITMTSGKRPSYLLNKTRNNWVEHLIDAKWVSSPGKDFEYINENVYMLCAILARATGQSVSDFLTPRLWHPLGCETPYWETDHNGIESGGWGIYLTPETYAKFFVCIHKSGKFNGKQIIPAEWVEQAILNQNDKKGPSRKKGYGFSFWRENEKTYHGEGMFGQIARIYEDKDLIILSTCGESHISTIHRQMNELAEKGLVEEIPDAPKNPEFIEVLNNKFIDTVPKSIIRSPMEKSIQGKTIKFKKEKVLNIAGFPMSVLPLAAVYMTKNRAGNINNVKFTFKEDTCLFEWSEGRELNVIECGMDGHFRYSEGLLASTNYTFCSAAFWQNPYCLEVWVRPLECIAKRIMVFEFLNGKVKMQPSTSPTIDRLMDIIADGVRDMIKIKPLKKYSEPLLEKIKRAIEPTHYGTYK